MKSNPTPGIVPPAEHPEVRSIADKVSRLRTEILADTRRIEDLSWPASTETGAVVAAQIREAAEALIEGGDVSLHEAVTDRDTALRELHRRRRLRREALGIAEGRLRDVRARASAKIIEAQRPAYGAIVEEMAPLVFQLAQLGDRERAFSAELEAAGVLFGATTLLTKVFTSGYISTWYLRMVLANNASASSQIVTGFLLLEQDDGGDQIQIIGNASSIDTSSAADIAMTGQLSAGGDGLALNSTFAEFPGSV